MNPPNGPWRQESEIETPLIQEFNCRIWKHYFLTVLVKSARRFWLGILRAGLIYLCGTQTIGSLREI